MSWALRGYQAHAVDEVFTQFGQGAKSVLIACPTGGGKTEIGGAVVMRAGATCLWLVHRRELLRQGAERLRRRLPDTLVGVIAPGYEYEPSATIQVATVQTLLARELRPAAELVVHDECHHDAADDWSELHRAYPAARHVGLTATPARADGRALGDLYEGLVVGAAYSELIRDGHLVQCRVFRPPQMVDTNALALDPLGAWKKHGEGSLTFAFGSRIELCDRWATEFRGAGIPSEVISEKTAKRDRDRYLNDFSAGRIRVLWNVSCLTEGVDVPEARCALLARPFDHASQYLQACGRVLRPAPGKLGAIVIDLTGSALKHGSPTEDRTYSLEGEGVRRTSATPLRQCPKCGACSPVWRDRCPVCGYEPKPEPVARPKIWDWALEEVYAGADTPDDAKRREYRRLRDVQCTKGFALYWVQREYKKLFGILPIISDATPEEREEELARLTRMAAAKGYKPGFAKVRYKETFGGWPPRSAP